MSANKFEITNMQHLSRSLLQLSTNTEKRDEMVRVEAIKEGQPIHELRVIELPKYDIDELKKLLNDNFGYLDTDSNTILTSNDVNNK